MLLLFACEPPAEPTAPMEFLDSLGGRVRVHYDPAQVDDGDDDGIPDLPQGVALIGEEVLQVYEMEGFAPPMPEAEVGLDGFGGSDAFDVFLVDIADETVDGYAVRASCKGHRCGGWIEVDMNATSASRVVAHELFHMVQATYSATGGGWLREGSATWQAQDYRGQADPGGGEWVTRHRCGLASITGETGCGEARYDVSALWEFFAVNVGDQVLVDTLEELMATPDGIDALDAALRRSGTTLGEQWPQVAAWNLATGLRAGTDGYVNASVMRGLEADEEGFPLRATANIEPLSARYYRLDHPGGALWMGVAGDTAHLRVSVHPVIGGLADAGLASMSGPYGLPVHGALNLGSFDAGGVWITLSNPELHGVSTPVDVCFDTAPCTAGCGGLSVAPVGLVGLLGLRSRGRREKATPPRRPRWWSLRVPG